MAWFSPGKPGGRFGQPSIWVTSGEQVGLLFSRGEVTSWGFPIAPWSGKVLLPPAKGGAVHCLLSARRNMLAAAGAVPDEVAAPQAGAGWRRANGRNMNRAAVLAFAILSGTLDGTEQPRNELGTFFRRQAGLGDEEIARVARGTPVVRLISTRTPAEILVFGAVFAVPPRRPTSGWRSTSIDFENCRVTSVSAWSATRPSSRISKASRSNRKTFGTSRSAGRANAIFSCRLKRCWSSAGRLTGLAAPRPDRRTTGSDRRRSSSFSGIRARGNSVLGTYRDKELPFDVRAQLKSWLGRSEALPIYFPELGRYLMDYPNATPRNLESLFYWEKVKFGLKPTLRLNHVIAYRAQGPSGQVHIVAVKQLYASHYFQLALDFTACVPGKRGASGKGFFLISLKGSTQHGLTGFRGSILRRAVVSKTRSAQEKALVAIKSALEQP